LITSRSGAASRRARSPYIAPRRLADQAWGSKMHAPFNIVAAALILEAAPALGFLV
jgi:hypothetical protein